MLLQYNLLNVTQYVTLKEIQHFQIPSHNKISVLFIEMSFFFQKKGLNDVHLRVIENSSLLFNSSGVLFGESRATEWSRYHYSSYSYNVQQYFLVQNFQSKKRWWSDICDNCCDLFLQRCNLSHAWFKYFAHLLEKNAVDLI